MWRRLALCPPLQGQDGGLWRAAPKLPSASPSWALKWEAWELPSLFSTAIRISSLWIPDTFTVHTMQAAPALPPCFGLFPCVWRAPEIELAHQDKSAIWSVRAWTQTPPLPFPDPVFISWHHYFPGLKLGWTFRDELATVSGLGECLALWVRPTHSKDKLRVINNLLFKLGHLGEWKQLTRHQQGMPRANRDPQSCCPHSSILAWRILWTEEPRLQFIVSQRVGHNWATNTTHSLASPYELQSRGAVQQTKGI